MAASPKRLQSSGIRNMLRRAWVAQGLIKSTDEADAKFEFKSSHGFRKRFKTQCELAGVKPLNVETLLGHDTGIAGTAYYRPTDSDLLQDYLKAVPALTISEAIQVKRELHQKNQNHAKEMKDLQSLVANLQTQVNFLSATVLSAKLQMQQEVLQNLGGSVGIS